ncbi:DMT family transporter, partial [Vibrio rotiferianus]
FTEQGVLLAVASGAIASGCGYVLWYQVMQKLTLLQAAISQLSVPAIAVILGNVLLGETLTLHSLITSAVILGGIALVFLSRSQKSKTNPASQ